jgi:pilus assembly protein Flp/PilA
LTTADESASLHGAAIENPARGGVLASLYGPNAGRITMTAHIQTLWTDESGQDLVEYALLVALIAIIVIAALRVLGPVIATVFNNIAGNLKNVN